jgi:hypothetical protein
MDFDRKTREQRMAQFRKPVAPLTKCLLVISITLIISYLLIT